MEKKKQKFYPLWCIIILTVFVTVSVSIGMGLLALPVELVDCGLWPFLVVSVIPLVMEGITILLFIELIQRIHVDRDPKMLDQIVKDFKKQKPYLEDLSSSTVEPEEEEEPTVKFAPEPNLKEEVLQLDDKKEETLTEEKPEVVKQEEFGPDQLDSFMISQGLDMHTIGNYLFPRFLSILFDICFYIAHISMITVFGLIGPQSLVLTVFGEESNLAKIVTFPYCFLLFLITVLFHRYIESLIAVLVFMKVSFFIFPLVLGMYIALLIKNNGLVSNPLFISKPYFVFASMVHGLVSFIPFMFSKVDHKKKKHIQYFAYSTIVGLIICVVITILWCVVIVMVVPQTEGKINLRDALRNGQLSTSPYTAFIESHFPSYTWVTRTINVFVTISVTVTLVTSIASLKHFLDGYAKEVKELFTKVYQMIDRTDPGDTRRFVVFARWFRSWVSNPVFIFILFLNVITFIVFYIPAQFLVGDYEVMVESLGFNFAMVYYVVFIYGMLFIDYIWEYRREKRFRALFPGRKVEVNQRIRFSLFGKTSRKVLLFGSFFYYVLCVAYGVLYTFIRIVFASFMGEMPF